MNKPILSLLLASPLLALGTQSIDLCSDTTRNLQLSVGEEFIISATSHSPARNCCDPEARKRPTILWELPTHTSFELINESEKSSSDLNYTHIKHAWTLKATQPGNYQLEFTKPFPFPLQSTNIETITIDVQ